MRLIQGSRLNPQLLVLCRKYGIDAQDSISPQELNSQLQQKWFKEGYLRYQISGDPPKDYDLALLEKLGFIEEIRPTPTWDSAMYIDPPSYATYNYEDALLLGALRARVVSRLHHLTIIAHEIKFPQEWKTYLFGGARPLDPVKESCEVLCTPAELPFKEEWTPPEQMPTTEAEMMELVWQQSQFTFAPEYKSVHYELVNTPLQPKDPKNPEGEKRSPNTGDTMKEWITKCKPVPGHYLAISNQPFVEYQELTLQRLAPEGFTIHACGPRSSLSLPLATYLDNIAKQLYEELQVNK